MFREKMFPTESNKSIFPECLALDNTFVLISSTVPVAGFGTFLFSSFQVLSFDWFKHY